MIQRYHTATTEELIQLGKHFGGELKSGDVVALYGDLGAGKTIFTKGIAFALGIQDEVTSPTFNIVSMYDGKMQLVHIDAYRLSGDETIDVLEYVREPYIIVVEWPQQLFELQSKINKIVRIDINNSGGRDIEIEK